MAKKEKNTITINDKDYLFEDLSKEQQLLINHIADLDRKIDNLSFNLQQLQVGRQAFANELNKSLEEEE